MTVVIFLSHLGKSIAQIANSYPNDSNIQADPNVIFTEMFEQDSVSTLLIGYSNISNPNNISFDSSVPLGSLGLQSCKLTSYPNTIALNPTEMRKQLPVGVSDSVFVRFYVKYNNIHRHHHSGIWLHAKNPNISCFPCIYPGRTIPPGDTAFSLGAELRGSEISAQTNSRFGMFNYWPEMNPNSSNQYWGNEFINSNSNSIINTTQWNCIEVMLKLNTPVADSSGEAKLWINGQLIEYYGKGFPNGTWNQLTFTQGVGQPFEGFKWRSDPLVVFNSIWIKNYSHLVPSNTLPNDILYDHIVVAKNYIGPIYTNPTGINELNNTSDIIVYPNPTSDIVKFSRTVKYIKVYNVYGQQEIFLSKETDNISTKELAEGIYIIQADNSFHKIIVRH